ncbi:lipoyl(octanoyl) transferase [Thiohalomonas denitrificans]|uniref:Octanoyltransferase n=1 Tax=Thiohalomonas denitrificans TaxID=415747 RepID=A0A1G5Q879_9GAMM|nr:lipoyl(octanoyl) transferase LipB [Thiohalomonas denitrificans]SCZ58085.1 lipoyl(octanoyl) transferase [Thiohalomonas denitrificans]
MRPVVKQPLLRHLGLRDYIPVWEAMRAFTDERGSDTRDEFWLVEHPSVFTQGLNAKPEHLLDTGAIPVVKTDRGGQVTYHGPGQVVLYPLIDLRRLGIGVRHLVSALEQSVVDLLADFEVNAYPRRDAPGVYVELPGRGEAKIASVGLRVRRGCSYHGIALNVAMEMTPFQRINPCGHAGLAVTQLKELGIDLDVKTAGERLAARLTERVASSE